MVLVFEQDHRFASCLERELAMLCGIIFTERNATVSVAGGRIEHPEAKTGAKEAVQRRVEFCFGDEILMHGIDESGKCLPLTESALQICTGLHGSRGGVCHIRCVMMSGVDVGHG